MVRLMARPRKWYPICERGRAVHIAHGSAEAAAWRDNEWCRGPVGVACRTRLEAEEWCAWHNYRYDAEQAAITARLRARLGERNDDASMVVGDLHGDAGGVGRERRSERTADARLALLTE